MIRASAIVAAALALARAAAAAPQVAATYSMGGPEHGLTQPYAMVLDPARRELWVAGQDRASGMLVVVDAAQGRPVASLQGAFWGALAFDPALGRVYAGGYGQVRVIDAASRTVAATWSLGLANCSPRGLAVDAATSDLLVFCDVWDQALGKVRQELVRRDKDGAPLAKFAFPTDAAYYLYGGGPRVLAGKVYLPLSRTMVVLGVSRGELWVFNSRTLAAEPVTILGNGIMPAGSAFDEADGTLFIGDTGGKVRALERGSDGRWTVRSTVAVAGVPWSLELDPGRRRLYCLDYNGQRVHVLDAPSLHWLQTAPVGENPQAAVVDAAGGRLWVLNRRSSDLSSLRLEDAGPETTVSIRLRGASDIAFDPSSARAYVTSGLPGGGLYAFDRAAGSAGAYHQWQADTPQAAQYFPSLRKLFYHTPGGVRRLNEATGVIVAPSALLHASALAALEGSTRLLVIQNWSAAAPSNRTLLTVFDAQSETVVRQVELGVSSISARAPAYSVASGKAYVPIYGQGRVAIVDVEAGKVLRTVGTGAGAAAAAVHDGLAKVFVANAAANTVSVLDARADVVIATVTVGRSPSAIAVKRRGSRVYVANRLDKTLSVLSAVTHQLVATLPLGGTPEAVRVDPAADRVYVTLWEGGRIVVIEDPHAPDSGPPSVSHVPVAGPVPETQPVAVRAAVVDDQAVASVSLTYWDSEGGASQTVPMTAAGGSSYEAEIPAAFLAAMKGTEISYFVDASDAEGNGPPTGSTPGTALAPNRFQVSKILAAAWSYEFGEVFGGFYRMIPGPSAAVGELRPGAAGLEIATGNEEYWPLGLAPGSPMGRWFLFDAGGGVLFWKDTQNDEAHSSVLLYDLDGDGTPEMLGGTTSGNQLQAIDAAGLWRWRHILGGHHVATPAADVVDSGGSATVFSGAFDSYFRALDARTGGLKWSFEAKSWIWSSPAVADLDGDGRKEVVFGSDEGMLYVLDASTPVARWQATLGDAEAHVRASPALADVTGDAGLEVLVGAPTGVFHCLDGRTGAERWRFATGGEILSSAAVGDLDGDGRPEIVFGSADGTLYALRGDGSLFWRMYAGGPVYASPALARRNPGATLDVYVTTLDGRLLVARGADGKLVGGFNVGAEVVSSPIVADVDGDGRLEIFFQDRKGDLDATNRGDVFWAIRDLGSSVEPFAREWPMFRADPAHSGVYRRPPPAPAVDLPPAQVTGLSVAAPEDGGRLLLAWSASKEADLAEYRLYRDGQPLATVTQTAYEDAGLVDGATYTYRVSAVDKAGGEGARSEPGSGTPADRAAPASRLLAPASGGFRAGAVAASGTASDAGSGVAEVRVHVEDRTASSARVLVASGAASWSLLLGADAFADGHAYVLRSQAVDRAGNAELPLSSAAFVFDGAPPEGALRIGDGSLWIASRAVTLALAAVDGVSGLGPAARMRFSADGAVWGEPEPFATSKPWDLGGGEGPRRVHARVSDAAGNWSEGFSASASLDLAPPSLSIAALGAEPAGTEALVTLSGTASDSASGVAAVEVRVTGPDAALVLDWTAAQSTASWRWEGKLAVARGKRYAAQARAVDYVGRAVESLPLEFARAELARVGGLAVEAPAEGGSLRLSWKANAEPDLAGYRLYRDGQRIAALGERAYVDGGLSNGATYSYQVCAVDQAGAEGPRSEPVVGSPADRLPPVSWILAPGAGGWRTGSVAVSGTASDQGSGLREVAVLVLDETLGREDVLVAQGLQTWSSALPALADGHAYVVRSRASDAAGNLEAPASSAAFRYDGLPPSASLRIGDGAAWRREPAVGLELAAADGASGLGAGALMRFSADGAAWGEPEPFAAAKAWDLGAGEGRRRVHARVSDAAGNWTAPFSAETGLDLDPPSVWAAPPALGSGGAELLAALSGTAGDSASGVASVDVRVTGPDGRAALDWTAAHGTSTWRLEAPLTLVRGKKYALAARAADRVGRLSESAPVEFSPPDLSAPTGLVLEAPPEGGALALSWQANPEPDIAGYRVYRDGKPLAVAEGLSRLDSGLTDGATYTYRVAAVDRGSHEGPLSPPAAAAPRDRLRPVSRIVTPGAHARLSASAILVSGTASDAGVAGVGRVDVGLAEGEAPFVWAAAGGGETFAAELAGLADGKTYRLAARALDREGNVEAEPAAVQVTVDLPPGPVTGLEAELAASGEAATLRWEAPAAGDLAGYRVYGPDGALAGTSAQPSFPLSGLARGKTLSYQVSAVDAAGQEGPKAGVSFATPAGGTARAWIRVPKEGKKLWGNAVTLVADTEGEAKQVLFQFRHESEASWTDVTSADAKAPYSVYWNISDARASTGSYRLRALAFDAEGRPDPSPVETRVVLDDANADLVEDGNSEADPNKSHRKEEKIDPTVTTEVALADGTSVVIPPGAVPDGETLQVKVVAAAEAPKPVGKTAALAPVGVFREFTFSGGTRRFEQDLTLTLPVPDEDHDGLVDGTDIPVAEVRVYYYSEKEEVWLPVESRATLAVSAAGGGGAGATFTTSHFTLFGLFQERAVSQAPALGEHFAFPNPSAKGKNPTFHVDSGPAQRLEVRVYDMAGQLVYSASVDGAPNVIDGRYAYRHTWDAARAASGVYLYVLDVHQNGAKSTVSGKVALVR
ncbi:MAG: PQQ-binding-like beta-propeller repeat protein [Elusimicrobia bacterium]|nr:PQQ-binding-like beta-propeller repeat protein [Elusimicrobiota bacterium]